MLICSESQVCIYAAHKGISKCFDVAILRNNSDRKMEKAKEKKNQSMRNVCFHILFHPWKKKQICYAKVGKELKGS